MSDRGARAVITRRPIPHFPCFALLVLTMRLLAAAVALVASAVLAAEIPIGATNSAVSYAPTDQGSWITINAPSSFNASASFNVKNSDKGTITIKSPRACSPCSMR